ncbi:abortive infection bacteriophage resistance protein [Kaistia hirudinis]|uniref:Abortive infection bacteriophage resistance protein n=1 Tax=Kaistia hirudinis TaxID=1293440 RepID=A0A840ANK8_9HYPH|nr:Abi family protein [Kaistia hirudinis]MBB3931212.1 abortive infection bacteriophage resistance protein [Kaistia hirudinis]
MKFAKPSLPIADQIALLKRRGMTIPDRARAEHYLQHVSYYRLRAYWLPFEQLAPVNGDHMFRNGTSIDDAVALYVFDRQLRLLVMDAIERIEVSLRGAWAYHLAVKYGSHGYLDPNLYDRADRFANALTGLLDEIERSTDTFIVHYKSKYDDPEQPPIWMTAEVMSLGQLSKWYSNLKRRPDRQAIAKIYGLDEKVLTSVAHHLTYVRNICAHHGRLWNKQFTVTMTIPNSPGSLKLAMNTAATRKLYNTLAVLGYLIGIVAPGTEWRKHLADLVASCPLAGTAAMGFPTNWKEMPAWKSACA